MQFQPRTATRVDRPDLQLLIARSARALGAGDYRPEQIEGALQGAFGVDSHAERNARELDPKTDAAKIRAFFVDRGCAHRGVGRSFPLAGDR